MSPDAGPAAERPRWRGPVAGGGPGRVAARFGAALRAAGVPADPAAASASPRAVTVARPATRPGSTCARWPPWCPSRTSRHPRRCGAVFDAVFGGVPDGRLPVRAAARPARPAGAGPPAALGGRLLARRGPRRPVHALRPIATARNQAPSDDEPATATSHWPPARCWPAPPSGWRARFRRTVRRRVAHAVRADAQAHPGGAAAPVPPPAPTPRGRQTDLRATLRQARRTGGHPLGWPGGPRCASRAGWWCCATSPVPWSRTPGPCSSCCTARRAAPRPRYSRFATRLTRLTATLAHVRPGVALQQAGRRRRTGSAGPGSARRSASSTTPTAGGAWRGARWSSSSPTAGTPAIRAILRREMERLSRVAHRIVWVNPADAEPGIPAAGRRHGRGLAVLRRRGQRAHFECPGRTDRRPGPPRSRTRAS